MVIRRASIDFGVLKVKFQSIRTEIANSKNINDSHREVLLYVYDQLIDGISKNQLCRCNNDLMPLFSIRIEGKHIFIKIRHRFSETIKAFKEVNGIPELIANVEDIAKECGLKIERIGNKELMEMEVYLGSELGDQ